MANRRTNEITPERESEKTARALKDQVIAFKADAALADLLGSVKNKSELIRDAVYAYLGHLCPLCEGKGTIPHNRSHEIALLLNQLEFAACAGCHTTLPVMPKLRSFVKSLPVPDRRRLEEFEKTGHLLCSDCFDKAAECTDCGQHVPEGHLREHAAAHHHKSH